MLRAITLLPRRAAIARTRRLRTTTIVPRGITIPRPTGITPHRVRTLRPHPIRLREAVVPPHREAIQHRTLQAAGIAAARVAVAEAAVTTEEVVARPTAVAAITNSIFL